MTRAGPVDARGSAISRRRIVVGGTVQGVGFRPFVHRLASAHGLGGFALNTGGGVLIEVEGETGALDSFGSDLTRQSPPLAKVETVGVEALEPVGEGEFTILPSVAGSGTAAIPPDTATCDRCLEEMHDPDDRRFRYPFINCTHCGPRFTIVLRSPYDRANTTMAGFGMCPDCRAEYEDPGDRRFHAEAIACPACGPRLSFGGETGEAALSGAIRMLREGKIVAVKGIGGYHLACDATDEAAVARLRSRKFREHKPFAVMAGDVEDLAELDREERLLLESRERPIVIARRSGTAPLAEPIAPGSPWIGLMLPYTPLHHLLCEGFGKPLVMTSGNTSGEPVATGDLEARERLGGIADGFLAHDRVIHRRCEDSVASAAFPIRRARGYAPVAMTIERAATEPILATGAEMKSTFCVLSGNRAFMSPHLGDLDSPLALAAFGDDLGLYLEMLDVSPRLVAHDLHPGYMSTRWALEQDAGTTGVQHHHAHAAACLAENNESGPALALVFDGTGYGTDGTLWGGELFRCDLAGFERLAHLEPVPLPGGERAIREPWRIAASYLELAGRPVPFDRWGLVRESLKANAPLSSGMGRLFDAVSAMLGVREEVTYEGQAAIELELLAARTEADPYPCRVGGGIIHGSDLVASAHDDMAAGRAREEIAAAFHEGVAAAAAEACGQAGEPRTVALSGGSFQNRRLLGSVSRRLEALGFRVLRHRLLPPNDGSISFGQAAVAARRMDSCA